MQFQRKTAFSAHPIKHAAADFLTNRKWNRIHPIQDEYQLFAVECISICMLCFNLSSISKDIDNSFILATANRINK